MEGPSGFGETLADNGGNCSASVLLLQTLGHISKKANTYPLSGWSNPTIDVVVQQGMSFRAHCRVRSIRAVSETDPSTYGIQSSAKYVRHRHTSPQRPSTQGRQVCLNSNSSQSPHTSTHLQCCSAQHMMRKGSWVEFEFRRASITLSLEVLINDRRISAARICS